LDEFQEVIRREKFGLSSDLVVEIVALVTEIAEIIVPRSNLDIISDDPSDNKFIECAIDGRADYIISGDKHLLDHDTYRGVQILRAKDFLSKVKE
jgi:putative PIN family toxin of toxin-antitoxin system